MQRNQHDGRQTRGRNASKEVQMSMGTVVRKMQSEQVARSRPKMSQVIKNA